LGDGDHLVGSQRQAPEIDEKMPQAALEGKCFGKQFEGEIMSRHQKLGLPRYRGEIQIRQKKNIRAAEKLIQPGKVQVPKRKIEKLIGKPEGLQSDVRVSGRPAEIQMRLAPRVEKEHVLVLRIMLKKPLEKGQGIFFYSSALPLRQTPYINPYAHTRSVKLRQFL